MSPEVILSKFITPSSAVNYHKMGKLYFQYCSVALLLLLMSQQHLLAQISNCNAFLKGKYIEAGVNWNGTFGSSYRPSAGYHPQGTATLYNGAACGGASASDSSIGFVADPDKDGWDNGTPTHFGDFILPGGPQEGWSFMYDAGQIDVWNHNAATSDTLAAGMTCSIMSYLDTNGVSQVAAQGIVSDMYITQFYSLDTNKLYIKVEILFENLSLSTMSNVYYMRTINPHNDQSLSSVPNTKNKIEYSLPDTLNRTVISTRGTMYNNAYLSLATQDPRAVGFISKTAQLPNSTTIDNIYSGDGAYLYSKNDSDVGNNAIGLIFSLGSMPSGSTTQVNFIYAFSPSVIDSTLNTIDTPNAVGNVPVVNYNLFPNPVKDIVTISGMAPTDKLELYDVVGRKVNEALINLHGNTWKVSGIKEGSYILVLEDNQGIVKKRFSFQKL